MVYTKKNLKSKPSSKASTSTQVASLATKVNNMMKAYQPELKVYDTYMSAQIISAGAHLKNLSLIPIGDGQSNRQGHQVSIKSIGLKSFVYWDASAPASGIVSVFLIQDTQQQSDADPTFADIFSFPQTTLGILNRETIGRYKILYKKKIFQDGQKVVPVETYKSTNINIRYNGVALGDLQKNGLYLVAVSESVVQLPRITYHLRLRYTDN